MTIPNLNLIQNQSPADAVPVNENFQTIQSHINTDLINRDGSVAMVGPLILSDGNPAISAAEAAAGIPVGMMMDWPAASAPDGGDWVLCNGQILTTADYPALHALIGGTYNNPGDDFQGTQFRVPNLNGRSSVAPGGSLGGSLGDNEGRADSNAPAHTHAGPSHSHDMNHGHGDGFSVSATQQEHTHSINHDHSADNTSKDGGHAHDTIELGYGADGQVASWLNYPGWVAVNGLTTRGGDQGYERGVTSKGSAHSHSFNVPKFNGTSGPAAPSITASISGKVTNHTGKTDPSGTDVTGPGGDGGSTDNYHPVLVLNKIMKAR